MTTEIKSRRAYNRSAKKTSSFPFRTSRKNKGTRFKAPKNNPSRTEEHPRPKRRPRSRQQRSPKPSSLVSTKNKVIAIYNKSRGHNNAKSISYVTIKNHKNA